MPKIKHGVAGDINILGLPIRIGKYHVLLYFHEVNVLEIKSFPLLLPYIPLLDNQKKCNS